MYLEVKNLLRVIEQDIFLWTVPLNYKLILTMTAMESMYFFVKFQIRRHIRLHRRHCKNSNNLRNNSLFSERYIISNEIVMGNYKWWFKKQLSLSLSLHIAGRTQTIWDLRFYFCKNDISFTSTRTRA